MRRLFIYCLSFLSLSLFPSCMEDYLDLFPEDKITAANFPENENGNIRLRHDAGLGKKGLHGGTENEIAPVLSGLKARAVVDAHQRVQKLALLRQPVLHIDNGADVADEGDAHDHLFFPVENGETVQGQMTAVGKRLYLGNRPPGTDDFRVDGHVENTFGDNARRLFCPSSTSW